MNVVVEVPLTNGGVALIDADDLLKIEGYRWKRSTEGYVVCYRREGGKGRVYLMHRLIMGIDDQRRMEVDHRNRNRLDNRRSNLRVATHAQNLQNRPSQRNGKSQFRGVYWNKQKQKWEAAARLSGKRYFLGYFDSEGEAATVASRWRTENMPFTIEASEGAVV